MEYVTYEQIRALEGLTLRFLDGSPRKLLELNLIEGFALFDDGCFSFKELCSRLDLDETAQGYFEYLSIEREERNRIISLLPLSPDLKEPYRPFQKLTRVDQSPKALDTYYTYENIIYHEFRIDEVDGGYQHSYAPAGLTLIDGKDFEDLRVKCFELEKLKQNHCILHDAEGNYHYLDSRGFIKKNLPDCARQLLGSINEPLYENQDFIRLLCFAYDLVVPFIYDEEADGDMCFYH